VVRGDPANPPALLLHGGGVGTDAATNWEPVLDRLAGALHCVAPDLLGFGASPHPEPAPSGRDAWLELWVDQCLAELDALGRDRVHVIGNSALGGAIALRLLADHPDRIDRAVILGGGGQPTGDDDASASPRGMFGLLEAPTHAAMAAALARFSAAPEPPASFAAMVDARVAHARRPEVQRSFRAMWGGEPGVPLDAPRLAAIRRPVLCLHGAGDVVADPRRSWELARALPAGALVVMPGAGHWLHLDRPEDFASLVISFLEGGLLAAASD
jgi:2-hydroxymuconate-semialdehyde hydrolase